MTPPEPLSLKTRARNIFCRVCYATIATVSPQGQPWISPVYCAFDEQYNIYWVSAKETLHSANIRSNSQVAIVIYDSSVPEGTGEGVYMRAVACELDEEQQVAGALTVLNARTTASHMTLPDVTDASPKRAYRAEPIQAWLNAEKEIDGFIVDCREEFDLV